MKVTVTAIPEVLIIEPKVFADQRGFFFESFNQRAFNDATGLTQNFVQDNHSRSSKGVLRGLHYQVQHPQGKLVRVARGSVFDVAVDIRNGSPGYGKWVARVLSAEAFNQLLIPKGFAHGFLTLEAHTEVLYKVTAPYAPQCDRSIRWNDPAIGIAWPLPAGAQPILSGKDQAAPLLADIAAGITF